MRAPARAMLRATGLDDAAIAKPLVAVVHTWSDVSPCNITLRDLAQDARRGIVEQALPYAQALGCTRLHVMAGLVPQGADAATVRATYIANVRYAAEQAAPHGIQILLEPINGRDMPGFFLSRQDQAHALIAEIGATNVKVQMDLYHCQIVEGDLAMKVRQYLPTGNVGHFQIAGVPERHEPDVGEVNYTYLFKLLDSLGYDGWIGCEYRPARGAAAHATSDGLGWLKPWL